MNSCFSQEDLGSNRLGAEFGRWLTIKRAENNREPVSTLLKQFLEREVPKPPKAVAEVELSSGLRVAAESLSAIAIGILDALIPEAY
jgi:hypothetical protein